MRLAFLTTLVLAGLASASTFAGYTIKPYGDQKLNLQSGVTTLGKGGVAADAERGVTIDAKFIEYKDGEWLRARDAKLTTQDGGTLLAQTVEFDERSGLLSASGSLKYDDARVRGLNARQLTLDTARKLGIAKGGVTALEPALAANIVVVDYANKRALMYGNYKYNYQKTRLSSSKPDALLLVTWDEQGQPKVSTKPAAELIKPYQQYLK